MAFRKYFIGSEGPYFFDDADLVDDPDGDFSGEYQDATITDGQHRTGTAPSINEHTVRKIDLDLISVKVEVSDISNPSELNNFGGEPGTTLLAYQIVAGSQNFNTIYSYDDDGPAVSSPQVVEAKGDSGNERWIAIGGEFVAGPLASHAPQHEDGGSDELNVTGLSGVLADRQKTQIHSSRHQSGGADELDGDQLDIDWNPSYYSPDSSPAEVDNLDELTSHLKGIDNKFAPVYKEIPFDIGSVKAPPSKSADFVSYGISGSWGFSDGQDDTMVADIDIPRDLDVSEAPTIGLVWSSPETSGDVVWQIETLPRQIGEVGTAVADQTLSQTTPVDGTADGLIRTTFTGLNLLSSGDILILLRIKRLGANGSDTVAGVAHLLGFFLRYKSSSRGDAI